MEDQYDDDDDLAEEPDPPITQAAPVDARARVELAKKRAAEIRQKSAARAKEREERKASRDAARAVTATQRATAHTTAADAIAQAKQRAEERLQAHRQAAVQRIAAMPHAAPSRQLIAAPTASATLVAATIAPVPLTPTPAPVVFAPTPAPVTPAPTPAALSGYAAFSPEEHQLALSPYASHQPPSSPLVAFAPTSPPSPSVPPALPVGIAQAPTTPTSAAVVVPLAATPIVTPTPAAASANTSGYAAFTETDKATASRYAAADEVSVPHPKVVRTISAYAAFDASESQAKSSGSYSAFNDDSKESVYRNFVLEGDMRPALQAYRGTDVLYSVVDDESTNTSPSTPAVDAPAPQAATPASAATTVPVSEKFSKKLESALAPPLSDALVQWNEEFQKICALPAVSTLERLKRSSAIRKLSQSFIQEVIISEYSVQDNAKTIKPINAGGVAGGAKFIHRNIFFKFPDDGHNLYGGETYAMKSASHEARGIRAYLDTEISDLHVPLMTCIDYKGRRLIASSVLPIGSDSLIYGSADGAKTVLTKDPRMNTLMATAGERLNLKLHGVGPGGATNVCGPADIEGHIGKDGLYYVVDTARLFPPEAPRSVLNAVLIAADSQIPITTIELALRDYQSELRAALNGTAIEYPSLTEGHLYYAGAGDENKRATNLVGAKEVLRGDAIFVLATHGFHLFNMLRPEWVRESKIPLSSDAFSGFGRADPKQQESNREVREHTQALYPIIHSVAEQLVRRSPSIQLSLQDTRFFVPSSIPDLTARLHTFGINNRYLGYIRSCLQNPGTNVQQLLLIAMISRVAKVLLRSSMRTIASVDDAPFHAALVELFNLLLGISDASAKFWTTDVKVYLLAKFDGYRGALTDKERSRNYDLRLQISKPLLFQTLCHAVGARFTEAIIATGQDTAFFNTATPFKLSDVLELNAKSRPITTDVQVVTLLRAESGVRATADPNDSATLYSVKRLHKLTKETFGLRSTQSAASYVELANLHAKRGDTLSALKCVQKAKALFRVVSCPLDAAVMAYYLIGQVHYNLREFAVAESIFKASLAVLQQLATPGHVLHVLVLNMLVETLVQQNRIKDTAPYVERFLECWKANPFRGNKDLRRQLFLRDIPIALSLAVSETGSKIDHLVEDESLNNRSVQAWLEQVQAAQNISDTTLATSAIELKISSFASDEQSTTAKKRETVSLPVAAGTKGLFAAGEYWNGADAAVAEHHVKSLAFFNDRTVVHYAASSRMQAAVLDDGSVYTWGPAGAALGHGEHTGRVRPTRVVAMLSKRVVKVAVGQDKRNPFLLLLTATGDVYSCGSNRHGQLGHGDRVGHSTPRLIRSLRGVTLVQIAATNLTSFAVSHTGELYVWGSAGKGETGMRSPQLLTVPTLNTFLPKEAGGVTSIATAKQAVVVSMGSGDAYIWGETFAYTSVYRTGLSYRGITRAKTKQLSGELPGISWSPVAALWEPLRDWQISSVAIGTSHLVFLTDNGEVYVRGNNERGQLGQGDTAEYKTIRAVNALRGKWVVQIAAARDISLALTANDEVFIWGSTAEPRTYAVPTLVEELAGKGIKHLLACWHHWAAMRQAVHLQSQAKQTPRMSFEFQLVPGNQVPLGQMVTLKYRVQHASADDRVLIEPSGMHAFLAGHSLTGEVRFFPDAEGEYTVTYRPVGDPANDTVVAKFSTRGSLFPPNVLLKPRSGTEPMLSDFLRSLIAQHGHLNIAMPTKTDTGVSMLPVVCRLILEYLDAKNGAIPPTVIHDLVATCKVPMYFDVIHPTHSCVSQLMDTLLASKLEWGRERYPNLVKLILQCGGMQVFCSRMSEFPFPPLIQCMVKKMRQHIEMPVLVEFLDAFYPAPELAQALNWFSDCLSCPLAEEVHLHIMERVDDIRTLLASVTRLGTGFLAWVSEAPIKRETIASAQFLFEKCPSELLLSIETLGPRSPFVGLFTADLLPVTGKLARLLLAKGLSLNVTPNQRAEGANRKITEQTILASLCGSNNTDESVFDIISSCVDPDEFNVEGTMGTPFGMCLTTRKMRSVKFMLELGVNPNHVDRKGHTALYKVLIQFHAQNLTVPIKHQLMQLLEMLLQAGADPRFKPETAAIKEQVSALGAAQQWGFREVVDLFLKYSPM